MLELNQVLSLGLWSVSHFLAKQVCSEQLALPLLPAPSAIGVTLLIYPFSIWASTNVAPSLGSYAEVQGSRPVNCCLSSKHLCVHARDTVPCAQGSLQ